MDFMQTTFSSFWSTFGWPHVGIACAIFLVMLTGVLIADFGDASKSRKWAGALIAGLGIAALASVFVVVSVTSAQENERSNDARAKVAETLNSVYGTDITAAEVSYYSGLLYPKEKPETDFEVFGSVERDAEKAEGGFERQTIYLIWQDEELRLAESADGEVFDVLGD